MDLLHLSAALDLPCRCAGLGQRGEQEAEEKRKLARTELELKADTQVQMMAIEKYKRVSRELELSPRSPNLYAVPNQSTTSQ